MDKYLYLTFPTSSDAIACESHFKKEMISSFKLIPIPRFLSAGCGMALRCDPKEEDKIRIIIKQGNYEVEELTIR